MNTFKIVFIGLNNETLLLINKCESFKVMGVNLYDYFNIFSFNPIDQLFKIVYKLHFQKKYRFISLFILKIWNKLHFSSSSLYRSNKDYLNCILINNIQIIETENTKQLSFFLLENNIDLLLINSWGIIPNEILNLPKHKTINIHPSLLPQYRGALPTLWSLKNGDKISALTYLVLNEYIDDGMIINQYPFEIEPKDDWLSLEKKIASILERTLISVILNYLNSNYSPFKTNQKVCFTGLYNKYREIDLLNEDSKDIYNKVGLYPYLEPFFYCFLNILGRNIYIKQVTYLKVDIKNRDISLVKVLLKFGKVLFFAKEGILKSRLFIDIGFSDSIYILKKHLTKKKLQVQKLKIII